MGERRKALQRINLVKWGILHIYYTTKYEGSGNRVRLLKKSLKLKRVKTRVTGRDMWNVLFMFKFMNMFTDKRKSKEKI